ncbi:MAG: 2-oxo acid dehydrogenase subunit E2 [Chitinophagales bacterium]|nr:2-oxo acid dehydrogenase subunit E2 [Chitinophagales bacterium]
MAEYQLTMPKMGESVIEATILSWNKKPGDTILENDIILEVATDKVDSEVPSPVSGVLKEILFKENDVVAVDQVIAIIETDKEVVVKPVQEVKEQATPKKEKIEEKKVVEEKVVIKEEEIPFVPSPKVNPTPIEAQTPQTSDKFYSPLVLNIAKTENISNAELDAIAGTGADGRVTKDDVLKYLQNRKSSPQQVVNKEQANTNQLPAKIQSESKSSSAIGDEIIEMDRMRKLIARNMLESKKTSAHVSSFIEVDMTNIVKWREKIKGNFKKREGFNLTYMPIFTEAIVKAIKDFPMINISVDGEKIIKKKNINIGIATALSNGNLIVPVVKNADRMNLIGLATAINQLSDKARNNQLSPTDIEGGTYTISNIGTFGNILGTPIIPQPQVAIMAVGAITKKPVVLETEQGDVIAIRHMMYLSHTYDHRVVDGALGGMFVKRVAEYLENFDIQQDI